MTTKTHIIEELGETGLVLPQLLAAALAANDRAKYYMSLLQGCRQQATRPDRPQGNLREERLASGESDVMFDDVVAASRAEPDGSLFIPQSTRIHERLMQSFADMMAPLRVSAAPLARPLDVYEQRLTALRDRLSPGRDGTVGSSYIDDVTRTDREDPDSIHLLVMDLHRELNALHSRLAEELIDGALVYAVRAEDKSLVRAFMRGVNATAPLKFDHPGLGTTATRVGDRLVIQNDIGTTDAHVLVIHVVGLELTMTYTDVHHARTRFFKGLFARAGLEWSTAGAVASREFETCVARGGCADATHLENMLEAIGSRLVFLIDWNRARKRLAHFIGKSDAIAVLQWGADQNLGHRAFLEAGGERLLYSVLERVAPSQLRYGARLDEVIGRQAAVSFLQAVLRVTSHAWQGRRSLRFVRDEVQAELIDRLHESEQGMLVLAADHASLIAGLAAAAHDALRACTDAGSRELADIARRAKLWETKADEIVNRGRELPRHPGDGVDRLLADADDVADGLEEVVFLLTLLNRRVETLEAVNAIEPISRLAVASAYEYVKCVEGARHLRRHGTRDEIHEFLVAVERLTTLEHESDEAERQAEAAMIDGATDFHVLHVLTRIAGGLEESIDGLARCALTLKDGVLKELLLN